MINIIMSEPALSCPSISNNGWKTVTAKNDTNADE